MSKIETNRQRILKFCFDNNGITTAQAIEMCEKTYYCNGAHHVQEILGRMAKSGALTRVKKGHYIMGCGHKSKITPSPNQIELSLSELPDNLK